MFQLQNCANMNCKVVQLQNYKVAQNNYKVVQNNLSGILTFYKVIYLLKNGEKDADHALFFQESLKT